MKHALGISVHTGWAACVVAGGTAAKPVIAANVVIEILGDAERFCYHRAAEMKRADAADWIGRLRLKAVASARRALEPLVGEGVVACAIVAKEGEPGDLDRVLASHPRLHMAEGFFYRDALREACPVPVRIVAPKSLDVSGIGKVTPPPWGKDQKLAALAAWRILSGEEA